MDGLETRDEQYDPAEEIWRKAIQFANLAGDGILNDALRWWFSADDCTSLESSSSPCPILAIQSCLSMKLNWGVPTARGPGVVNVLARDGKLQRSRSM